MTRRETLGARRRRLGPAASTRPSRQAASSTAVRLAIAVPRSVASRIPTDLGLSIVFVVSDDEPVQFRTTARAPSKGVATTDRCLVLVIFVIGVGGELLALSFG